MNKRFRILFILMAATLIGKRSLCQNTNENAAFFLREINNTVVKWYTTPFAEPYIRGYAEWLKKQPGKNEAIKAGNLSYLKFFSLSSEGGGIGIGSKGESFIIDSTFKILKLAPYNMKTYETAFWGKYCMIQDSSGYHLMNGKGEIVTNVAYENCKRECTDGLWAFSMDHKWGFIDENLKEVIPFIYDETNGFLNGLGVVCKNKKYGVINKKNQIIIPFEYDWIEQFYEGLAVVRKDDRWWYINEKGIDELGLQFEAANRFIDGYASVKKDGKWGVIDRKGNWLIKPVNDNICVVKDGLITIEKNNDAVACINIAGDTIIPMGQYKIRILTKSKIALFSRSQWFIYDITKKKTDTTGITKFRTLFPGGYADYVSGEKYGLMNKDYDIITPPVYDYLEYYPFFHRAMIHQNRRAGLIDDKGKIIIQPEYDFVSHLGEGMFEAKKDGKYFLIDINGQVVNKLDDYVSFTGSFYNGLARIKISNGLYGYVDHAGKQVIPLVYYWLPEIPRELIHACIKGKWGYIDRQNKVVIPLIYDEAGRFINVSGLVRTGNDYYIINREGIKVKTNKSFIGYE